MMKIVQIVPKLPPITNGLGDYALNLARQLRQDFAIETHFVVGNPEWQGQGLLEDFLIAKLPTKSSEALATLLTQLNVDKVLLHYVGYGYAKRGYPNWLIEGLKQWREGQSKNQLVTMVHEVYASSYKPWTSSFWLSPLQKKLAARLIDLSDRVITNTQAYATTIANLGSRQNLDIPVIPVFSNIGEPIEQIPFSDRKPWLAIFGNVGKRKKIYTESLLQLNTLCKILQIEKIIDIGSPTGLNLTAISDFPVREMGQLPASEISSILLACRVGFLNYNPNLFAKSTIFAAYCAHGLLPISAKASPSQTDGIESEKNYLVAQEISAFYPDRFQQVIDNASQWYQSHNLAVQASVFASQLQPQTNFKTAEKIKL